MSVKNCESLIIKLRKLPALLAALLAMLSLTAAHGQSDSTIQMLLGNPSGATSDPMLSPNNYLITRPQYAMSYMRDKAIPRWVSWHLSQQDVGSSGRSPTFYQDTTLPAGWYQATNTDYTGSGYDRGHNCPSGDRTATTTDNKQVFYLSNIMPQAPDNNQGPWEVLESYCRTLASQGNELYIICGTTGTRGTIASGKIAIPGEVWKIILVLPNNNLAGGANDLARITSSTRVIAVNMPNVQGIRAVSWQTYRCSVYDIEDRTGYYFFSNVNPDILDALKSEVDTQTSNAILSQRRLF